MDAVEQLTQLGFGDYEARAYATLVQHGSLSGYELARLSGIPRPNVYAVLDKLEERGAVARVESSDAIAPSGDSASSGRSARHAHSIRYGAVPASELLARLGAHYQSALRSAGKALSDLAQPEEVAPIYTIHGDTALLEHARGLVASAEERLLLAVWPAEASALAEVLEAAEKRGVALMTLCLRGCPNPCGACRGQLYSHRVILEPEVRWLAVIRDGAEALAGEIRPGATAGLRSRQRLVVDLIEWYTRHTIALAAILAGLGDRPAAVLDPGTLAVLSSVGPAPGDGGWLAALAASAEAAEGEPAVSVSGNSGQGRSAASIMHDEAG